MPAVGEGEVFFVINVAFFNGFKDEWIWKMRV